VDRNLEFGCWLRGKLLFAEFRVAALRRRSGPTSVGCDGLRWKGLCVCGNPTVPFAHHRSFISFHHSHSSGSMSSSSSNSNVSFSPFQDLFDTALREYNRKTGKDIATDPLTTRLLRCDSSDAVLGVLQEQAHTFNQFRNGDWKVQLVRRLKPTVDILLGLSTSGAFGEGIGLVRPTKLAYPLQSSSSTAQSFPPAKAIFAGVGLLLAVCVPLPVCLCLPS
jgi:hypothetical protein